MFAKVVGASLEVEVATHLKRIGQRSRKTNSGLVVLLNIHLRKETKVNWVNPG